MLSFPDASGDEDKECTRRLLILHDAICEWRRRYQRFPKSLAELVKKLRLPFNSAACPIRERASNPRGLDAKLLSSARKDPLATYEFELDEGAPLNAEDIKGLGSVSRAQWKSSLLTTAVGPFVPLVRCDAHRGYLNLANSGRVYHSDLMWEYSFNDRLPETYCMPFLAIRRAPSIHRYAARRDDRLGACSLDLSGYANALPSDPWLEGQAEGDTLADLPACTVHGGVMFDSRYLIQTCGSTGSFEAWQRRESFGGPSYPSKSREIQLPAGPWRELLLLAGCAYPAKPGATAGEILIRTATGARSHPVRYGADVAVWRGPVSDAIVRQPAWSGASSPSTVERRLYRISVPLMASDKAFAIASDPSSPAGLFIAGTAVT